MYEKEEKEKQKRQEIDNVFFLYDDVKSDNDHPCYN